MPRPWLLKLRPPDNNSLCSLASTASYNKKAQPELMIWWAVTRQAAWDLVFHDESIALDALEFLRSTGKWIAVDLFGIPNDGYERGVIDLIELRAARTGQRLPIELLRRKNEAESS